MKGGGDEAAGFGLLEHIEQSADPLVFDQCPPS